jgi:hypothetical protein
VPLDQIGPGGAAICCVAFVRIPLKVNFGQKAAKFSVIMTSAKRYNPIATPIARCIVITARRQNVRVFRGQINSGYPVSNRHTEMLRTGNKFFHPISVSGGSISPYRNLLDTGQHKCAQCSDAFGR